MDNALISIIVPIYNREKYIEACVESIINQTYNNTEIILVDDGSTDGTPEILRSLAERDSRIKVITKENGGVSSARNAGIEAANGAYISFVDSDDTVESEMLEKLVSPFMNDDEVDLTSCGYEYNYLDSSNGTEKTAESDFSANKQETLVMLFDRTKNHHFKGYNVNKLYKAEIIKEYGVRFDGRVRIGEDIKFNFDYMRHIRKTHIVAYCGYRYTVNSSSATYTTIASLENENEDLVTYYLENTEDETVKDTILRWAIIYYRGILYECYHGRNPERLRPYISRFFRKNMSFYKNCTEISKKDRLFAVSVGLCEPLYRLTQKITKGE